MRRGREEEKSHRPVGLVLEALEEEPLLDRLSEGQGLEREEGA